MQSSPPQININDIVANKNDFQLLSVYRVQAYLNKDTLITHRISRFKLERIISIDSAVKIPTSPKFDFHTPVLSVSWEMSTVAEVYYDLRDNQYYYRLCSTPDPHNITPESNLVLACKQTHNKQSK